jgi:hypothetical protein
MADDIRDEFEPIDIRKVKGWKGLKAINRRMKDYYESSRRQQEQAEARRPQAPITLPKFKCLEDGK